MEEHFDVPAKQFLRPCPFDAQQHHQASAHEHQGPRCQRRAGQGHHRELCEGEHHLLVLFEWALGDGYRPRTTLRDKQAHLQRQLQ